MVKSDEVMIDVVAVVGPTASGKTALSIELAKRLGGEIVSCDSMQIYRKMNIGTAKPTAEEMAGIPHHLIDIIEPEEAFSCADYAVLARQKIEEISSRGKLPIFCGGTGLYVDHALGFTAFSEAARDDVYREELACEIEQNGIDKVFAELQRVDPESAAKIHPNNTKRVIRALEIYKTTGKTKTEWDKESMKNASPYAAVTIALDYRNRETLYDRINKRVDIMMEEGLLEEVKSLLDGNRLTPDSTAAQAIGYKELTEYFEKNCSLDEAVEKIKLNTRNYAKRQLTWFRRNKSAFKLYMDEYANFDEIVNIAEKYIASCKHR